MGCSLSSHETSQRHQNRETGKQKEMKDQETERQVKKVLILGSRLSGKSTLLRQIKLIHDIQADPAEKHEAKRVIRMNLVDGMLTLLKQAHRLYESDSIENKDCEVKRIITTIIENLD